MSVTKQELHNISNNIKHIMSIKFFNFIIDNPDKPWSWNSISHNPNITMDIIKDNPDKPWDWNRYKL